MSLSVCVCVCVCGDAGGDWRSAGCRDWAQRLTVVNGRMGGLPELFAIHWTEMRIAGVIQGGFKEVESEN